MDFTYGTFPVFSKIEARFGALLPAVAGYLLDVVLRFVPNNPPAGAVVVENLQMAISTGEPRREIGVARPAVAMGAASTIATRHMLDRRQFDSDICFWLRFSPTRLEEIEVIKNGKDLSLSLDVSGLIKGYAIDGSQKRLRRSRPEFEMPPLADRCLRQPINCLAVGAHSSQAQWASISAAVGTSARRADQQHGRCHPRTTSPSKVQGPAAGSAARSGTAEDSPPRFQAAAERSAGRSLPLGSGAKITQR
jgi:hypothetical protein